VFDKAPNATSNRDTITDFNVLDDTIALENAIFTALGLTTGTLTAAAFRIGTAAGDADDRIIYNSSTGALFYDSNGNAAGGSVQIATLTSSLALTNNDFWII
jgi:serralysin